MIIILWSCHLNQIGGENALQRKNIYTFLFTYIVTFTSDLFLHVNSNHSQVSFHLHTKDSFQGLGLKEFLQVRSASNKVSAFVYL